MSYGLFTQARLRNVHELQGNYPYMPPAQNVPSNYSPQEHMGHHNQSPLHNYPLAQHVPPHFLQGQYDFQQHSHHYNPSAAQFPYGVSPQQQLPPINTSINPRSSMSTSRPAASASPGVSPTDPDQMEESMSVSEDKRRRNTAASGACLNCVLIAPQLTWVHSTISNQKEAT